MPRNRNGSEKLKRKGSKAVRDTSEKPSPPSPNPDSVLQNNNQAVDNSNESNNLGRTIYSMIRLSFGFFLTRHFIIKAFEVRMHAINEYGYVIHEFDPWFNFRATEVSKAAIVYFYSAKFMEKFQVCVLEGIHGS